MDMEIPEEFNDHTMRLKGKRAKRQRPFSPAVMVVTPSSSTGGDGGGGDSYSPHPSPATSGDVSTTIEEDEDMANCLILLAQGDGSKQVGDAKVGAKIGKFLSTTTTGKPGFYVYECKTCDRTFPSFQALGGHRASHKKPKANLEEVKREVSLSQKSDEEETKGQANKFVSQNFPFKLETNNESHIRNKSKVHECSVCGAEFSSGQALGGHMRRHRVAPAKTTMSSDRSTVETLEERESKRPRIILALDLNLPAPPEDFDHLTGKQHLVFASPVLVDCHY